MSYCTELHIRYSGFHYENLISHGEYPVFIDIEVLCGHITKNYIPLTANEKAKLFVENSVLGSGILQGEIRRWIYFVL